MAENTYYRLIAEDDKDHHGDFVQEIKTLDDLFQVLKWMKSAPLKHVHLEAYIIDSSGNTKTVHEVIIPIKGKHTAFTIGI